MAVTAAGSGTKTPANGTFTVTIASPGVFTKTAHGLTAGDKLIFSTTGALPTGLTAGTTYFVIAGGLTSNDFEVSTTDGGSAVNTSGSQSGTHTITSHEAILLNVSAAGVYTLHVDSVNLADGDVIDLRAYQMILTSGTRRAALLASFFDAQHVDDLIKILDPLGNELADTGALRWTLTQRLGTARAFPWKVLAY
jgi:hypothetical protein